VAGALFKSTFGLINLGPSRDELYEAQLVARARVLLRGHFKIGVLGKGGVGKTSVAVSPCSLLAELRQEDRVVAIDADTAFGKLGLGSIPMREGRMGAGRRSAPLHLRRRAQPGRQQRSRTLRACR
jgi:hypothetical protein